MSNRTTCIQALIAGTCLLAMLSITSCGSREHNQSGNPIMTNLVKGMRPFCIGRFSINIPAEAKVRVFSQSIEGFGEITVHPETTKAKFFSAADAKERALREKPHRKEGTVLNEVVTLNDARILVYRDDGINALDFDLLGYFWKDSTGYEFAYGAENDAVEESKADLQRAIGQIAARDNDAMPTTPGFCVDHAIVSGNEFRIESAGVAFTLPSFPGVEFVVDTSSTDELPRGDDLITRSDNNLPAVLDLHPDLKIESIRKGRRTVIGLTGLELVELANKGRSDEGFGATWEYRGEPKSLAKPTITLDLRYGLDSEKSTADPKKKLTSEDLLAFWDAYVDSLHVREN